MKNENENQKSKTKYYMIKRDRVQRQIKPPSKIEDTDFVAQTLTAAKEVDIDGPKSFEEARVIKKNKLRKNTNGNEMNTLQRAHTWTLIEKV